MAEGNNRKELVARDIKGEAKNTKIVGGGTFVVDSKGDRNLVAAVRVGEGARCEVEERDTFTFVGSGLTPEQIAAMGQIASGLQGRQTANEDNGKKSANEGQKVGGRTTGSKMKLKISVWDENLEYSAHPLDKIKSVKKFITEKKGIKLFTLVDSKGKELDENDTLRDAGLSDGAVVEVAQFEKCASSTQSTAVKTGK